MKFGMVLLITILASLQSYSFAGGVDGGGGIGVRCLQANGTSTLELLDLHEARLRGWAVNYSPATENESIALTVKLFAQYFWNPDSLVEPDFSEYLKINLVQPIFERKPIYDAFFNKYQDVIFVNSLPLSKDIGNYNISPKCSLEQIAYFSDKDQNLKIVESLWQELDYLNQAALAAHELLYMFDRAQALENFGSLSGETSERSRYFVGQLFSGQPLPSHSEGLPANNGFLRCGSIATTHLTASYFYAYSAVPNELSVNFSVVQGMASLYQMTAKFQNIEAADMLDPNISFDINSSLILEGSKTSGRFLARIVRVKGTLPQLEIFDTQNGMGQIGLTQEISCY